MKFKMKGKNIMKTRKIIKLVNNERINRRIESEKACDASSQDVCAEVNNDFAECTLGSIDLCVKDYAGCSNGHIDYCPSVKDYTPCYFNDDIN